MEQHKKLNNKINEIRIGILGLSGSGKTTFNTAISYFLHYRNDKEIYSGEPVGKKPRKYLEGLIDNVRNNQSLDKTNLTISLSYRLKYKDEEYILNTVDYDGVELTKILTNKNKQNNQLLDFISHCDAYLIFISSESLIKKDSSDVLNELNSYIDFIRSNENQKNKISIPIVLCITKSDLVKYSDQQKQFEASINLYNKKLQDQIKVFKSFKISSIDPRLNKDAIFSCSKILDPLKCIFEYKQKIRARYKLVKSLSVIVPVFIILCLAILSMKSTAKKRYNEFKQSTSGIESLSDEDLDIKKYEIEDLFSNIGFYRLLIAEDIDEIKENGLAKIFEVQNQRDMAKIPDFASENDSFVVWQQTIINYSTESFENYIAENESGSHREEAEKALMGIFKNRILQRWYDVSIHIENNPVDFENINSIINEFIEKCPFEIRKQIKPSPESTLNENTKKWDLNEWKNIVDFESKNVKSKAGSINNVLTLIQMMKDYQELFHQPIYKVNATKLIEYYSKISSTNKYKVILTNANYKGGVEDYEKNPDIYIKVFVNDVLQYDSSEIVLTDNRNPTWNAEFTINWKAYDSVILEVWDKNLIDDELMCKLSRNDYSSAHTVFRSIYYPSKADWKLRVSFNWLGPKR